MADNTNRPLILFCYPGSPWSLKISTYLNLRNIPYFECHQPTTWPRPDLQQLNINYRRIPLLAIGKDIYCDTSLMLEKLEGLFADHRLGCRDAFERAQESLLEQWSQTVLVRTSVALMPPTLPLFKDQVFVADRKKLFGVDFSPDAVARGRPDALANMNLLLQVIEGLLSDGRDWISGSDSIGLADLHVGFVFDWLDMTPGALPPQLETAAIHPKARQYLQRYTAAVTIAREQVGPVPILKAKDAIQLIRDSDEPELLESIEPSSQEAVSKAQIVALSRIGDFSGHRDIGILLSLSSRESVIGVQDEIGLRLHCPRNGFCITPVE